MKTIKIIFFCILFIFSSCKKESNPVETGDGGNGSKIQTGESVELITKSIGTTGGIIKVEKPGDILDGIEITIPPNSYTEYKTFKVTYAEVKSHKMGEYFNPISPFIKISYEGGYADDIITIKIPVKIPEGYFAMGFFFDENTGTLEGLPLLDVDSSSITVCTRHFSTSTLSRNTSKSLFKGIGLTSFSNMIVSSIKESKLMEQPVISTGYKLKEDDWEFPNYGSYIAPGGHCAGQSITSMWYYYEKNLRGAPNLYSQYDEIEKLWTDNPRGYRFASTIQEDLDWDGILKKVFNKIKEIHLFDFLSWHAFAYSMLFGEPQYVALRSIKGGHAIVAYQTLLISPIEGLLYVADPNFPGQLRTIKYENGQFQPYSTKRNAAEIDSTSFTEIGYCAKTSIVDWNKINSRWEEFENGTIGNDRFPNYQLWMVNGGWQELKDGLYTDVDTLKICSRSTQCLAFLAGTDCLQLFRVYNTKGDYIAVGNSHSKGIAEIRLNLGLNRFGIHIMGARDTTADNYVDFKWINIIKDTLTIHPKILIGQPNKEYTFTANSFGTAPIPYKMIWNFGDGSPEVSVNNDSICKHIFSSLTKIFPFEIDVKLYNQLNQQVAEAFALADISSTPVTIISSTSDGEPISKSGVIGKKYTFIAIHNGQAPKNGKAKFVWDFGDSSPVITVMNDSLVNHTFTKAGTFTINVQIFDDTKLILKGSANAEIKSTTLLKIESASTDGAPILTPGIKNKEYSFIARTYGTAPTPYKMIWNFGDNTTDVIVNNDSAVSHTYTFENSFTIDLKLFDKDNIKLAETTSVAIINSNKVDVYNCNPIRDRFINDTVIINGIGFGDIQGTSYVTFNPSLQAQIISWSNEKIIVTIPEGATSGPVTVYVGNSSDYVFFEVRKEKLIDIIKNYKKFKFSLMTYIIFTDSTLTQSHINRSFYFESLSDTIAPDIIWSGNNFTYERNTNELSEKAAATFSDDGRILTSFKCEYDYSITLPPPTSTSYKLYKEEFGFTLNNIPYYIVWKSSVEYAMKVSEGLVNNIDEVYWNRYYINKDGELEVKIYSLLWDSNEQRMWLKIY